MIKKNSEEKKYITLTFVFGAIGVFLFLLVSFSFYFLSPIGDNKQVEFVVNEGDSTSDIAKSLEKQGLIKSDKFFMGYVFVTNHRSIYAAKYDLNSNMKLSEIIDAFDKGGRYINEITFKEGINMRDMAKLISKNTNNSYDDVINQANDKDYVKELIKKYWFIDKSVFNDKIYYSLEGYLFPDSYYFASKDVTVKEIFDTMINNTDKKLEKYEDSFKKNKYTTQEIFTIASLLELEANNTKSRKDVAGVFYNRLTKGMSLGSDISSYYGVQKDMTSDLTVSEINSLNAYNTRAIGMEGKLPVGPICNPSLSSIVAALNPSQHDYYYFVTDKNGKVYLTKNFDTHNKVINDLKDKGLWFEW